MRAEQGQAEQEAMLQESVLLHWEAAVHYWRRVISDIKSFRSRGKATNNVCGRFYLIGN
ncbi:hypothetical protein [Bartonella saheliensis]|uniref:hypothetical protein n=1 Tax=Bartonella saheliensis TaxID=1457016 RepID=UPI00140A0D28|nr:hypothetical protein [Bartonella saheliensis]